MSSVPRPATERQLLYLKKAAQCAFRSNMTQRHGCVIVDPVGKIVSTGHNFKTTHRCHRYSTHAEVAALSKLKKSADLTQYQMYVVRLSNAIADCTSGNDTALKSSMPCPACMEAINKTRLGRVWFSQG